MGRQYVHLSVDIDTANLVGKRKDSNPVLLKIKTEKASNEGVKFYQGNNAVWLANYISSNFISVD
ncbi:RNA 2'-phosphotransferase [Paenibacillus kribbensis]|uniref:RNA 2'-phosphotransferase n=1 Tax=Paenibacillus kribbensis TaxID=172713 RepID=UPI001FC997AB|nr:RNA 2'-phosphotransferase [Paenibacillus kribbensis]